MYKRNVYTTMMIDREKKHGDIDREKRHTYR